MNRIAPRPKYFEYTCGEIPLLEAVPVYCLSCRVSGIKKECKNKVRVNYGPQYINCNSRETKIPK